MAQNKKPRKPMRNKTAQVNSGWKLIGGLAHKAFYMTPEARRKSNDHADYLHTQIAAGRATKDDVNKLAFIGRMWQEFAIKGKGELQGRWIERLSTDFQAVLDHLSSLIEKGAQPIMTDAQHETVSDVVFGFKEIIFLITQQEFNEIDSKIKESAV